MNTIGVNVALIPPQMKASTSTNKSKQDNNVRYWILYFVVILNLQRLYIQE